MIDGEVFCTDCPLAVQAITERIMKTNGRRKARSVMAQLLLQTTTLTTLYIWEVLPSLQTKPRYPGESRYGRERLRMACCTEKIRKHRPPPVGPVFFIGKNMPFDILRISIIDGS